MAGLCGRYAAYRHIYRTRTGDRAGRLYDTATGAAEAIAAGKTIVSPIAPDMIVFDLDGCAVPALLEDLDTIAAGHGALLACRTASGSDLSEHRIYTAPPAAWSSFRAAVRALEDTHRPAGVTRWALDDRTANQTTRNARLSHGLRLPGSPSLKPGCGPVVPLDAAGHPVSLETAALMIRSARLRAGLPLSHGYSAARVVTPTEDVPETAPVAPTPAETSTPAPSPTPARSDAPTAVVTGSRRAPANVVAPVGGEFTPAELAALAMVAPVGQRSEAALPAMRAVVRHCGTSWADVRDLVMSAPAFAKYAAGGETRARSWWTRTTDTYLQWLADHPTRGTAERPTATPEQTDMVLRWLEDARVRLWGAYDVQRAARAWSACMFIGRLMLDGRGTETRPVAVRDLVQWGVVESAMGGSYVLRDVEAAGVLVLDVEYSMDNPLEARRWSLPEVVVGADTTVTGVSTPPRVPGPLLHALTSPGCHWLPPTLRALLAVTTPAPLTTTAAAAALQVSPRSARRWYERLAAAGLALRDTAGRWAATPVKDLETVAGAAPEAAPAGERLEAAREQVAEDRAGWRRLWRASIDALGRTTWRFKHWLTRGTSAGRSTADDGENCAESAKKHAMTCGDAAVGWLSGSGVSRGRRPVRGGPVEVRAG